MSPTAAVRAPGVPRTLALALLARVPLSAIGLLLVLQVRHLDHSYTLAGACSGACALGMALGSPLLGRAIDRVGQPIVLVLTGVTVTGVSIAFAFIPAGAPAPVFLLIAAAIGAAQPPVGSCVRVLWRRMLDREGFNTLVTLDASLQELAFLSGPLLLISLASASSAAAALAATGALLGLCAGLFALLPETRRLGGPEPAPAQGTTRASAIRAPGVRLLLVIAALMGVAFGATELGIVTAAEDHDAAGAAGALFALWGVGSFVGGVLWTRRAHTGRDGVAAIFWLLVACGVTSFPLAAATGDLWLLGGALALTGAAIAPLFGVLYALMGDVAPTGTLTEAFTWETSAITGGIALGSAAAGAGASALGAPATFILAGAAFLLAAVAHRAYDGALRDAQAQARTPAPA